MARQVPFDDNPTVVAIDKDKHSQSAVRWAIEHLLITNPTLILIHVKTKNSSHNHNNNNTNNSFVTNSDANAGLVEDLFVPFRTYCARKRITLQEVVLEGMEIHSTLLDYINNHHVTNIVLGNPTKHIIARKFWTYDVPTLINKAAPDYCSVYVISKGKIHSVRPAARQIVNSVIPPKVPPPAIPTTVSPFEQEDGNRSPLAKGGRRPPSNDMMMKPMKNLSHNGTMETNQFHREIGGFGSRISLTHSLPDTDMMDITQVNIPDANSANDQIEVERLKLEVQQTISMYNTACKEAISAKQHANELRQIKMDETSRLEQSRLAEEAAFALIEIEKAKCRAAIEAAEKAQKIAEKETQRRKYAEMKAKREAEEKNRALDVLSNNDARYRKYSIEEIEEATQKFSRSMKIGEGGYGPVYQGKLDHTPVAIKVLRPDAAQGRKQFQQEVEVLSCMRHPNMVLLMGACPEYGCLVYEFMNNGSLEDRLFRKGNTPPIPWGIRFKIASDIATGLLFLHQAKPEPLVHRDLKPANILLDHHYTCKISDVGLARLVPVSVANSVTQYHMTSAAGTFCYIDPEYQQTGKLGTKSDIYSLGVMLLQIITARPPMGLTHHVERAIGKGTFADLLDPTVPDWPLNETLEFAKLALKCSELRKKDRPDLGKDILPELNRLKELGMNHEVAHGKPFT